MKNVLITGGSRGIGRCIAELLSENGYKVAFTYKNSENEAKSLAERIGALAIRADSLLEEDVKMAVRVVGEALGGIDFLVNNAAISGFSLLTDLSLDSWNETLGVSLTGAFLYSREVLPSMIRKKQGRIVNISSMWGMVGASCEVHYSAAKAGLIGFTKALAKEVGPSGITVNAIAPGLINTEMNGALSSEDKAAIVDETPLCRIGEPIDVARAVLFLLGEGGSFITGEVINVSGGLVI